jgi:hypothetical protein
VNSQNVTDLTKNMFASLEERSENSEVTSSGSVEVIDQDEYGKENEEYQQ